jgi:DNA-binding CsgD family transcriptional regulator/tetratricopeptide (TPR) repeat protein
MQIGGLDFELIRLDSLRRAGDAIRVAERLEQLLSEVDDDGSRVDLFVRLAHTYAALGRHALAARALQRARAVAGRSNSAEHATPILVAQVALTTALGDVAPLPELLERLRCSLPVETDLDASRTAFADASMDAIETYIFRSETSAAQRALAALDEIVPAEANVPVSIAARRLRLRGHLHFNGVDSLPLARNECLEAYRLAKESGDVSLVWEALYILVDYQSGSLDAAEIARYAHVLLEQAEALGDPRLLIRATLLVAATEAQQHRYDAALDRVQACRPLARGAYVAFCDLAEAYALHRAGKPRGVLARLETPGDSTPFTHLTLYSAIAELYRGRAFSALGDRASAVAATATSLEMLQPDRFPYYLERGYRQMFDLTGREPYLARAVDLSSRMKDVKMADDALAPLLPALRHTRVVKIAGKRRSGLTPRQREIAELVHQGLTNRAIAAQLRISERTVAHHVEEVLSRLGLRARWQIPALSKR